MKYEEIIKLLDAGYSRDEILAMKEEPAPAPDPEPTPDDPEPTPAPDPADTSGIMEEVKGMFAEMKKELIAMNIMNSRQESDELRTGEDILASIINPVKNNGGK